ncbi:uncharacterized protein BDR25DRAFT_87889 [Lindgomyces ingoldianus]|uniref:Uncharacterized protein n=1 Tax=Lindgomyces ingoldianus TaxID=673940 RepID=A0ACB6R9D2_9PLEO|nr:uncharacterized protein BDR25DRAFT_87889 [Lindgomyces ingoldianus]KAF2475697.1 hypothetical protein BDR25DRAFT_87889 [Lindgomyces ingoldianus]
MPLVCRTLPKRHADCQLRSEAPSTSLQKVTHPTTGRYFECYLTKIFKQGWGKLQSNQCKTVPRGPASYCDHFTEEHSLGRLPRFDNNRASKIALDSSANNASLQRFSNPWVYVHITLESALRCLSRRNMVLLARSSLLCLPFLRSSYRVYFPQPKKLDKSIFLTFFLFV